MTNIRRILKELPRDMVGDNGSPNVYFVTDCGATVTVTLDGLTAYAHWRRLADRRPRVECALEDRKFGCMASVEPREENSTDLVVIDDTPSAWQGSI
jgi:hypothetical protein